MKPALKQKIVLVIFFLSLPTAFLGLILQTILFPLQDIELISKEELKQIQLDVAINYPLGIFLLYTGLTLFVVSSVYLIIIFIRKWLFQKN